MSGNPSTAEPESLTAPERRTLGAGFYVALAVLVALGLFVGTQAKLTTDMTRFLPTGGDASDRAVVAQVNLMRDFATSELSRTMILLVEAPSTEAAVKASRDFEAALKVEAAVGANMAFVEGGPPQGIDRGFWELYQPRRLAFLATTPAEAQEKLSAKGLERAAAALKDRLAMPLSPLVTRAAPGDPLMITAGMFDRMQPTRAVGIRLADGRFVTADGKHAALFLGTTASAFSAKVQRPLLEGVKAAFDRVNDAAGGVLTLKQSGVNRLAVAAETAIKGDIQRVSVMSVVSVILLFLVLFGSLRIVAVTIVPVAAGMLAGTAGCLLLFGAIHGLTLAFGAALIGVCIDYAAHTYCHHQLEPDVDGGRGTVRRVWSGLALGAATTITGFVALGGATFPGLREVGVFGALGVAGALGATRWLVPPLMQRGGMAGKRLRGLASGAESMLAGAKRRPVLLWIVPLACFVTIGIGAPKVHWNDDLSEFGKVEGPLMDEDSAVRTMVAPFEQRRFVVAVGADDEAALQINDEVARRLSAAQADSEVESYRSVAMLLPSAAQQRAVDAVARNDKGLWTRLETAFAKTGFNAAAFEPFKVALAAKAAEPVTLADVMATPVASMVRPFRVTLGDRVGYISFLQGVQDGAALGRRFDDLDGATALDFGAAMTTAYSGYRQRMVELLLFGLAAVVLLLGLRYRDLRLTLSALVPSLVAAATTVAVLALVGVPLSVLTLTALLMVVCMGVDYGVFLAEAAKKQTGLGATMAALVVAALSTLLGFGLLALSDHPALMSLGLTAVVGVGTSVILAPTALLLSGRQKQERV